MSLERRTPMKRTPMKRGKPLDRGTSEMKRTPVKQRSAKRAEHMRTERAPLVASLIEEGVTCKVCPVLERSGVETHCGVVIGGMHERRKRSAGGSLVNPKNLIPSCNWANGDYIENNPEEVRELFGSLFVVREGDPEWEELGRRNDRFA